MHIAPIACKVTKNFANLQKILPKSCIYRIFFVFLHPIMEQSVQQSCQSAERNARIGVFDSGFGGLTILHALRAALPQYDYLYLGDNARAPYGTRSFDCVYRYTLEAVRFLFSQGCNLIILACNTASAKALRTIQQQDLPLINEKMANAQMTIRLSRSFERSEIRNDKLPNDKLVNVLGVIRPTVEIVPSLTHTRHVGVLATPGTVASDSYRIELLKQDDRLIVNQQACPMWVPLIENGEHLSDGASYFVRKYVEQIMARDPLIDTLLLGCTHYPLIQSQITSVLREMGAPSCRVLAQGDIVARSLADYLRRHPEYENHLSLGASCQFLTTDDAERFASAAALFIRSAVTATHVEY